MKDRLMKTLLGIALLVAFALGGAALAGAVQGGSNSAATTTTSTTEDRPAAPPQRSDETPLTGETAEKVRAAALAEVEGATVVRLETDGDGNAAYEAHLVRADGTRVTVYVNREFEVVGTEEGRGRGPGRGDCGPPPGDESDDSQSDSDGTSA